MTQKIITRVLGWGVLLVSLQAHAVTSLQVRDSYDSNGKGLVNGEGILQGSPESVWIHLSNFNNYSKFMPRVVDSFFISEQGLQKVRESMKATMNPNKMRNIAKSYKIDMPRKKGQLWSSFVFMELNAPFPVENRWYILESNFDETRASSKIFKRCWSYVVGNIESADGCWDVEPSGADGTYLKYVDNVNPGGNVPRWVSRAAARQTIPDVFRALEKRTLQASTDESERK